MKKYKIIIAYNGLNFYGFQSQPGQRTVQDEIEKHLSMLDQQKVRLYGASRTDSDVHARGQVAHFSIKREIETQKIALILNRRTAADLYITDIKEVTEDFNARHDSTGKHYCYRIWNSQEKPLFNSDNLYWYPNQILDIKKMNEQAKYLIGTHDFTSFASNAKRPDEDKVRTIWEISITKKGSLIEIDVRGKSFLYKMVRAICGNLLEVGRGKKINLDDILKARTRSVGERNLPGKGLTLEKVYY